MVLYSRADSWLGWASPAKATTYCAALGRIFRISWHGLISAFRSRSGENDRARKGPRPFSGALRPDLRVCLDSGRRRAERPRTGAGLCRSAEAGAPALQFPPANSTTSYPERRRFAANRAARHRQQARDPTSRCRRSRGPHRQDSPLLRFFSQPVAAAQHLKLMMNGTLFATVQPTPGQEAAPTARMPRRISPFPGTAGAQQHPTIELSATTFWFAKTPPTPRCGSRAPHHLSGTSNGDLLPWADDVKQLPMPFSTLPSSNP